MIKFLINVNTPYDVLEENTKNYSMYRRFNQVETRYQKILKKAVALGKVPGKLLFFQYGGDISMSGDLSNELNYLFPDRLIVVVYLKGVKANISARGKKARDTFLKAIERLDAATGGGHEVAVGGQMKIEDVEAFRENLEKILNSP